MNMKPRTTGLYYNFVLHTRDATGATDMKHLTVVALTYADAWFHIGMEVKRFMNGPDGRLVTKVWLKGLPT